MEKYAQSKDGIKTIYGKKVTLVLWEVSLGEEKTLDFPMAEGNVF